MSGVDGVSGVAAPRHALTGERLADRVADWPVLLPVLTGALVLLVGVFAMDGVPVGAVHDDAMYVLLAKALATGHGYRWINVPGAPAATHFPPGYPALLALVWRLVPSFPENVIAFKFVNALLLALAAATLTHFARRRLNFSARAACAVVLAGALAVPTLVLSTVVMSEMFFLALLIPALWLAERVVDDDSSTRDAVVVGLLAGMLMLVRSHGVAFVVGLGAVLAWRSRWRTLAIVAATSLATVLPWQLWVRAHRGGVPVAMRGDYESYAGWLSAGAHDGWFALAARTVAGTSRELFAMIAGVSAAGLPAIALRVAVATVVVVAFAFGLWRLRRSSPVLVAFIAAYLSIVLLWPFTPARFVWGVWPLIVLVVACAARDAWSLPRARLGVASAGIIVLAGYATYNVRGYRGRWWSAIPRQTAGLVGPSLMWVQAYTKPSDVVSSNAEATIYLYTGRAAVPATSFSVADYFTPATARSAEAALRSILVAYPVGVVAIVANDSLEAAARAMAAAAPPVLAKRDSVPHGLIYSSLVR
ncbi:MAG TPA: hypothetical protein VN706_09835 [Gemmatimonadaceae bacterium]|nr:hypothetical protein [Gemmatimonadaceae bacterium]